MVGRLLSYWEGNFFRGELLNFGEVIRHLWLGFPTGQDELSWIRINQLGPSCKGFWLCISQGSFLNLQTTSDLRSQDTWGSSCVSNPKLNLLLVEEILHQLRLVVYLIICRVSYIPGGCYMGFLPSHFVLDPLLFFVPRIFFINKIWVFFSFIFRSPVSSWSSATLCWSTMGSTLCGEWKGEEQQGNPASSGFG